MCELFVKLLDGGINICRCIKIEYIDTILLYNNNNNKSFIFPHTVYRCINKGYDNIKWI